MTLLVSDIVTRVRSTLLDAAGRTWSDAELISYLNGGMTQVVALKPDAYPVVTAFALDPGSRQQLPMNGVVFMDCISAGGNGVTVQATHEYIRVNPGWAAAAAGPTRYVLFDPRLPRVFHVAPPAQSGEFIELMYGAMADRVSGTSDTIDLPDWFESALWAFVVASAYAKNSKRQDFTKSDQFMKMFVQFVTAITPAERATAAHADNQGAA